MAYSQISSVDLIVNQLVTVVVNSTAASKPTTAGTFLPVETIIYSGAPQNYTTPALGTTLVPLQTKFTYKTGALVSPIDQVLTQSVRNTTNLFGNSRSYSGYENLRSVQSTAIVKTWDRSGGQQNWSNISSNVSTALSYTNYTAAGTYTWTVPAGVTSISILGVGGGGGGAQNSSGGSGGSGGSLNFVNNLAVTPGDTYTIVVGGGGSPGTSFGNTGGDTYIYKTVGSNVLWASGGGGGDRVYWNSNIGSNTTWYTAFTSNNTTTFQAISPRNENITYSIVSGSLPPSTTLNANTGVITGNVSGVSVATYTFTVQATTATQTVTKSYSIILNDTGSTANAVASISTLRSAGITTDGPYWFSTAKQASPFQAYIRFNYIDGGDWALLLKVHNQGDMPSGSAAWTNTTLQNATDWNLTSGSWSKYATWNGIAFTRLMMVMTQGGVAKIPPIMIFGASRTMAEAIALAGGASAYAGQNNTVKATSTDPAIGVSATYWNVTMKSGTAFNDAAGAEDIMQAYGIGMWANNSTNSTTAETFASTGRAGAWIGCPLDEGAHTFNNDSNTGADSAFGFGFAAGNGAKTGSAGYAEWTNASSTNTLPGYVWVR